MVRFWGDTGVSKRERSWLGRGLGAQLTHTVPLGAGMGQLAASGKVWLEGMGRRVKRGGQTGVKGGRERGVMGTPEIGWGEKGVEMGERKHKGCGQRDNDDDDDDDGGGGGGSGSCHGS